MKKTTVKRIWQWLVVRAFHAAISLARVVPLRVLHNIAGGMGLIGYALSKRYRNVSMKNLNLAYGDTLSLAEKKAITRKVFINFGIAALAEFPYMSHYSKISIIFGASKTAAGESCLFPDTLEISKLALAGL
jgi:lauroyl/myristoyl acyltransferase